MNKTILLICVVALVCVGLASAGDGCTACETNLTLGLHCALNESCTLTTATYYGNDTEGIGFISIGANDITLDCNGASLVGNRSIDSRVIYNNGGYDNITIKNCNISNYYYGISMESGTDNVTIHNNYFYDNSYYSIYLWSGSKHIYNNQLYNSTMYISNVDNSNISFNNITCYNNKCGNVKAYGLAIVDSADSIITNNIFDGGEVSVWLESDRVSWDNDITFQDNIIKNNDKGMYISGGMYTYIINNTFQNSTLNYDDYDVPIKIIDSSYTYIEGNNFKEIASFGIMVQKSDNVSIINNSFDFISMASRENYLAQDFNEPITAIGIVELYKGWLGGSYEISFSQDNVSYIGQWASSNITISGNTFDSDTQVFLKLEGATNVNHDLTDYWYRRYWTPKYLVNQTELYINNDFDSLSNWDGTAENFNLYISYGGSTLSRRKYNLSISKTSMTFKNVNQSVSYNLSLFNLSLASPYNDIKNITSGLILATNQDTYNVTIAPNHVIEVGYFDLPSNSIIESDMLEGLPDAGTNIGNFLGNLAPGLGKFIIVLAVFVGIAGIIYTIIVLVKKRSFK